MNKHHTNHKSSPPEGDGNDLICGFGRRRRTEESGDSYNSDPRFSKSKSDTLICGFGEEGGSYSSGMDIGEESLQEALQEHWVFEGDLPGREESVGSDSNTMGINGENNHQRLLTELVNGLMEEAGGADDHPITSAAAAPSELAVNQGEMSAYVVSTKVDDGSSSSRKPARRNSNQSLLSRSDKSVGDMSFMSMASEDAVVLMMDLLNESQEDINDEKPKSRPHTEICGRVYRHVPNVDYDHIPTELEIGSDLQHSHGRQHNNNDVSPLPTSVNVLNNATRQTEEGRASEMGPPRNISIEHEVKRPASTGSSPAQSAPMVPQSFYNATSKQKSNAAPQSPQEVSSPQLSQISSTQPQHHQQQQPQNAVKQPPEEFPRPKKIEAHSEMVEGFLIEDEKFGQISSTIEKAQRRRSTDLGIIEEGSRDSQSESMGLKSSFASTKGDTSTDYAFDDDDAFDKTIDPEIDILAAVVSRKESLTGEHAKSMAKELKASVRTCEFC
jgi:hypothetical protein